jgi:WD40 repeat protein
LISASGDNDPLRVWNVATGTLRKELPRPDWRTFSIAVSPDGTRFATVDWTGKLSVREVATGQQVASVHLGPAGETRGVAFSQDGRWLASTTPDFKLCLWDTRTYQLSKALTGHTGQVFCVAFSPDSQRLASAGQDRIVRVWDLNTEECVELRGHTDDVFALAFHPDGTRLATAGRDRAVWVWDLEKHEDVARLAGHVDFVWSLAFSPDGRTLASGSGDNTVRLWDTEPLRVRHQARREIEVRRPEAERLVDRLLREKKEASRVAQALKEDKALSELLRRTAFHALLRRAQADR